MGSNPNQFNRLVKGIDRLVGTGKIKDEVILQTGKTPYRPRHIKKLKKFWSEREYVDLIKRCDVFVTHGGLGNIMGAKKFGKRVLVVPRLSRFGEHVDDHQLEITKFLEKEGKITAVYDVEDLLEGLNKSKRMDIGKEANKTELFKTVNDFIEKNI